MQVKRPGIAIAAVVLVGLSLILASLLFWGGGREEDNSRLFLEETLKGDETVKSFVRVQPQKDFYHIGDFITIRFGTVYLSEKWKLQDEPFRSYTPLPNRFEVKSREVSFAEKDGIKIIEVSLKVQCLECRNGSERIGAESLPFNLLAKNKETGRFLSVRFPDRYIEFEPLVESENAIGSDLFTLPVLSEDKKHFYFFGGAALSMLTALLLALFIYVPKGAVEGDKEDGISRQDYIERLGVLRKELGDENIEETAHVLYFLAYMFRDDFKERAREADSIFKDLETSYSSEVVESLSENAVLGIINKLESWMSKQGEV